MLSLGNNEKGNGMHNHKWTRVECWMNAHPRTTTAIMAAVVALMFGYVFVEMVVQAGK